MGKVKAISKLLLITLIGACSLIGIQKDELHEFNYIIQYQTHGLKIITRADSLENLNSQVISQYADSLLDVEPLTVTNKKQPSPSGSYHDYMSKAPYFWPNPDTENSLPYIRRDGQVNPETNNMDDQRLNKLTNNVRILTAHYKLTKDERYAKKAIELLRVWFIDDQTKMNPHLRFAQGVPGVTDGRYIGIIEGRKFAYIVDTFFILKDSQHWNKDLENELARWFKDYNDWLWKSTQGRQERNTSNNHASWYDFQVAIISNTLGNQLRLRKVLNNLPNRIDSQIDKSGKQPHEIDRTKGLHYSIFNLLPLTYLVEIGMELDYDSLTPNNVYYPSKESKLISAIDYLIPFIFENKTWSHQQINELNECRMIPVLQAAYEYTNNEDYLNLYRNLSSKKCNGPTLTFY